MVVTDLYSKGMRASCICIVLFATAWSLAYVCVGGTPRGKGWFSYIAAQFFEDYKGGVPILTLAVPLIAATSLCKLLFVENSTRSTYRALCATPMTSALIQRRFYGVNAFCRTGKSGGDFNFHVLAIFLLAVPCSLYLVGTIYRHLNKGGLSTDKQVMEVGNSFGMTAMVAMSWFLVPVAKHSILLSVLGWSPIQATVLHIWSGRVVVIGSVVHGTMHMVRWALAGESVLGLLIPPKMCWSIGKVDSTPICVHNRTECSCYHHFRNFTGFVSAAAMTLVFVTSIGWVRRSCFRLFYTSHVILAPTLIIMAVMHYNRMILFICPSIIYYLASTVPVWVQALASYRVGGTSLTKFHHIPESGGCVELCFEASNEDLPTVPPAASLYVRLCAPEVSSLWHPFTVTINSSEDGRPNAVVIFRATGPFTTALSNKLLECNRSPLPSLPPTILLDGIYGGRDRLTQALRHDSVVMIAGGIGITPFLSLAPMLHSVLCDKVLLGLGTNNVTLHWICRDEGLITYVVEKHFAGLLQDGSAKDLGFDFRILIHHTRGYSGSKAKKQENENFKIEDDTVDEEDVPHVEKQSKLDLVKGRTLIPALFAPEGKNGLIRNIPACFVFSSISWIGLLIVWYIYRNVHKTDEVWSRAISISLVFLVSLLVSLLANFIFSHEVLASHLKRISHNGWERMGTRYFQSNQNEQLPSSQVLNKMDLVVVAGNEENTLEMSTDLDKDAARLKPRSSNIERAHKGDTWDETKNMSLSRSQSTPCTTLEHRVGRPSVGQLMDFVSVAESPGIFVCGPQRLMENVKAAALREREVCGCKTKAKFSIYEESFGP